MQAVNSVTTAANGTSHASAPSMTTMLEIPQDLEETIRMAAQQRGIQPEALIKEAVQRFLDVEGEAGGDAGATSDKQDQNPHGQEYQSVGNRDQGQTEPKLPKPQYSNEGLSRQSGEDFDSPEIDRDRSEATGEDF